MILYINACVRDESRTNMLAQYVLKKFDDKMTEICLNKEKPLSLDKILLKERNELIENGAFNHPSFQYAKQFANADTLVIAAPYWDLSFPAILRTYLERINVAGITFKYTADGKVQTLCNAKKLIYITTAGGPIFEPNFGYELIKQQSEVFWGITDVQYFKAEGLDIVGADIEKILKDAEEKISI